MTNQNESKSLGKVKGKKTDSPPKMIKRKWGKKYLECYITTDMQKLLFVIKCNYKFPKVQLPSWIMWDKGERPMEFPSRVHSRRMRVPGFALGQWALFEWELRGAGFRAGSGPTAPRRARLAPSTGISWCLGLWTLVPGTRWKPWAISVTTCTVVSSLVRGVTELLALLPVALSSSSVPRQHLRMKEYDVQSTLALCYSICSSSVCGVFWQHHCGSPSLRLSSLSRFTEFCLQSEIIILSLFPPPYTTRPFSTEEEVTFL